MNEQLALLWMQNVKLWDTWEAGTCVEMRTELKKFPCHLRMEAEVRGSETVRTYVMWVLPAWCWFS
jgi:hypothetical protein